MSEKEILIQLKNLKNIKPDLQWKKERREVLLSQISGGYFNGSEQPVKASAIIYLSNFLHQPALVVVAILVILLGGGALSVGASRDSKPGDSLYIAKLISEKAQLVITFSDKEKAKLGLEFAGNRAKEITQVLAESNTTDIADTDSKVEELATNFRKEISLAKIRLKKVNIINDENKNSESGLESEDAQIFTANLSKEQEGTQIYEKQSDEGLKSPENIMETTPDSLVGTTSQLSGAGGANSAISDNVKKAIEEAESLFDNQDYGGTMTKLEEANSIINLIDKNKESEDSSVPEDKDGEGKVLGTGEGPQSATSTGK